jgi:hypothetical protein
MEKVTIARSDVVIASNQLGISYPFGTGSSGSPRSDKIRLFPTVAMIAQILPQSLQKLRRCSIGRPFTVHF